MQGVFHMVGAEALSPGVGLALSSCDVVALFHFSVYFVQIFTFVFVDSDHCFLNPDFIY